MVILGCSSLAALRRAISRGPAAVVHVRALAVTTMFPADLADELRKASPVDLACAVTPPEVAREAGAATAELGDTLVFAHGRYVGSADRGRLAPSVLGLLRTSLGSTRPWNEDHTWEAPNDAGDAGADPFSVIGVSAQASFEEVRAAWRARLAEYHPDRFAKAGAKIRQVAESESQRINAAFEAITRRRGPRSVNRA